MKYETCETCGYSFKFWGECAQCTDRAESAARREEFRNGTRQYQPRYDCPTRFDEWT